MAGPCGQDVPGTAPPADNLGAALELVSRDRALSKDGLRAAGAPGPCWGGRPAGLLPAGLCLPSEGGGGGRRTGGLPLVLAGGGPRLGGRGWWLPGLVLRGHGPKGLAYVLHSRSGAEGPTHGSGTFGGGCHPLVVVLAELAGPRRRQQGGFAGLPGCGRGVNQHWLVQMAGPHSPVTAGRRVRARFAAQGGSGGQVPLEGTVADRPPGPRGAATAAAHRSHRAGPARLLLADQQGVLHPAARPPRPGGLALAPLGSPVSPGGVLRRAGGWGGAGLGRRPDPDEHALIRAELDLSLQHILLSARVLGLLPSGPRCRRRLPSALARRLRGPGGPVDQRVLLAPRRPVAGEVSAAWAAVAAAEGPVPGVGGRRGPARGSRGARGAAVEILVVVDETCGDGHSSARRAARAPCPRPPQPPARCVTRSHRARGPAGGRHAPRPAERPRLPSPPPSQESPKPGRRSRQPAGRTRPTGRRRPGTSGRHPPCRRRICRRNCSFSSISRVRDARPGPRDIIAARPRPGGRGRAEPETPGRGAVRGCAAAGRTRRRLATPRRRGRARAAGEAWRH